MMRPGLGLITTIFVDRNTASGMEWVTNTTVFFVRSHNSSNCALSLSRTISSSAPNGSSISRSLGSKAKARAIDTRCCMPPDSCHGNFFSKPARFTNSRLRLTFAEASAIPMISSGSPTLASTVRHGRSAGAWNT